jgi:hypothetical protein
LFRVFSEIDAPGVKVRETADRETPARSATSFSVTDILTRTTTYFHGNETIDNESLQPVAMNLHLCFPLGEGV